MCSSLPSNLTSLSHLQIFSSRNNLQGSGIPEIGNGFSVAVFYKSLEGDDVFERFLPSGDVILINRSQGFLSLTFVSGEKPERKHMKIVEVYEDEIPTLEAPPLPVIETLNDEREPYGTSIQQASENRSMDKRPLCEDELRPSRELVINQSCPADDGKMCGDSGNNFHVLENCQKQRNSKKKKVKEEKRLNKEKILPFLSLKLVDAAKELGSM